MMTVSHRKFFYTDIPCLYYFRINQRVDKPIPLIEQKR